MNEQVQNEQYNTPPAGGLYRMPVDLTQEEFVRFHLLFHKKFGRLKMQKPAVVMFTLYMLYFLVMMGQLWMETGEFPLAMVCVCVLFAASMAVTMVMLPRRMSKAAENNYRVCEKNGYYGECTLTAAEIRKDTGDSEEVMPLTERTLYVETADGMAFLMMTGEHKTIFLPARCMTEEAAKAVRDIVFAPSCRIQRRVIARMTALADKPMERRLLFEEAPTLYTVDVVYEESELKKLGSDHAWHRFGKGIPLFLSVALFLGAAMAMAFEEVFAGLVTIPAAVLLYLLAMLLRARRDVQNICRAGRQRLTLAVTQQSLTFRQPPAAPTTVLWKHVERAVETPDSVEFYYGGSFMRVPKRAIDDMDTFRRIVDDCMKA